ncbi:protein FAR1-RELATED SEQUENCE 2 isoform X1 [Senna tora]|uniref:Protein FAR1-RELATED SEQUENCE n=1 Tax=Senna tora TaxID=362788 RepID=A0A834TT38_9FABA|nr:protein FAR1-RELATED SEQUENCE 2 isoform X1 [Senna tora]
MEKISLPNIVNVKCCVSTFISPFVVVVVFFCSSCIQSPAPISRPPAATAPLSHSGRATPASSRNAQSSPAARLPNWCSSVQVICVLKIDLEMPTCEQEKSEIGSFRNGVADTACDMHVEDQSISSPIMTEHCMEVSSENALFCQDQVEMITRNPLNEPQNGLEFDSKEEAYSFYREYARSVGFGITIRASRRSKKSGKFIDIKIACSRFGSKRESGTTVNPRPCIKTDCKAGMHMKKSPDGKWIIYSFVKEHNHEMCPDDLFRGRNKQPSNVVCQKKGMQLALDDEDVQLMIEYFVSMQSENPNFFYAVDIDHYKCLRSVFWVDSKGRLDYQNFHDVVFIDTFYMRNKYKIPFVPIVGVNHHFQYILLGSALIGEETTSAFIWLMQTWLKAMGSLVPNVIITDQDKFLKEAVAEVFPDTRHFFSVWHILRKFPENLGYMINENSNFMTKFNKCIHYSWSEEQFEKRWQKLIIRFELKDNGWVQSLYEDRKKWIPAYMQDMFLAGLSTTVRSESIVSYFDKYVSVDYSFKDFIGQYKVFSTERLDMEMKADSETRQKQPALRSLSPFEKQLSLIYTDAIFRKFQLEILGMVSCQLQKEREDGANVTFQVDDFEEREKFIVSWNESELNVCCSCRLFEYKGILCRHAILIFQISGLTNIPSHYILKRWTKDAKANQFSTDANNMLTSRVQRFNDLCRRAIRLSEIGSLSQDAYHVAFQALEEVYKHCVNANNSVRSTSEHKLTLNGFVDVEEENCGNHKTKSTKKKKSYNKRGRSEPERINSRMHDTFQKREQMNSRAHNFDNCYIPQQDTQTVDLDSRAPILDSYYGVQQNMHGDGQLNLVSSMHDGYYGNQPAAQRLGQLHSVPSRSHHYGMQQCMQGLLQGQHSFRNPTMQACFDLQENLEDMEQPVGASQFHSHPKETT